MVQVPNPYGDFVEISTIPSTIYTDGISVNPNQCFSNAHNLASRNAAMTIIEGVCLGIHEGGDRLFFCHVWNKSGDLYYDITREEILAKFPEIVDIVYSPGVEYTVDEFSPGDAFKFRPETTEAVTVLNNALTAGAENADEGTSGK